jgi:hypothetical protein
MSAFGGEADITRTWARNPFLTQLGQVVAMIREIRREQVKI